MVICATLGPFFLAASLWPSLAVRVGWGVLWRRNRQRNSTLQGSPLDDMAWSACHKNLVIEWASKPHRRALPRSRSSGLARPVTRRGAFVLDEWRDTELFLTIAVESPGCKQEYKAECAIGALVVRDSCNGKPVDKELQHLCLGSKSCMKAGVRRTSVKFGDMLFLNLPKLSGGTCKVALSNGAYVETYTRRKNEVDSIPNGKELAQVAAGAAMMTDRNECGVGAMRIHGDPSNSARTLAQLAGSARVKADKVDDSSTQALHSLLELHFQERRLQFSTPLPRGKIIQTLAHDFKRMQKMQSGERLPNTAIAANTAGMVALSHYYTGLASFPPQSGKRRALIFTCSFGGGHKSAASAVSGYLTTAGFETHTIDTTYNDQFYHPPTVLAADFFNDFVIKRQHYKSFNAVDRVQQLVGTLSKPCPSPTCNSVRKQQFRTSILDQRPDIIVTVYHMELLRVLELAKELGNIPVLHVATDIDIKAREIFSGKVKPIYPKFLLGVPFDLKASYETVVPIQQKLTFLSGYPVRSAFLEPFDEARAAAEKEKFVPKGTKLMLIMTGGGGQDIQWPYKLAEFGIGIPLHIVVIAGGNNALARKMRASMPFDKTLSNGRAVWHGKDETVTFEIARDPTNTQEDKPYVVFEDRLALLMDMADVMLSKPGGGSTAEIAYRGVPAVFDTSGGLLHWEKFTADVFERAHRGVTFRNENGLRIALLTAIGLGRSQVLAEDANGQIINTEGRVVEAAEYLMAMPCRGCNVLE